jgi:DNA replication and repair protein RecF
MLNVISGAPSDRRKYFDVMFAQVFKSYAAHASTYRHALSQRNALLKSIAEKGRGRDQLDYWNDLLAEHGSAMMSVRANSLVDMSTSFALALMNLSEGREALHVRYNSSFSTDFDLTDRKLLKSQYVKALHDSYRQDLQYCTTTIGPHRDEYRFIVNDIDLGYYGSRGQLRSAMHALKFGEADWMRSVTGRKPVILLDEAFSELDVDRRRALLQLLEKGDQSVVTVSDVSLIEETSQFVTTFHVENGIIKKPEPVYALV